MKRIAVTGANGLLGWHLRCHMSGNAAYEVRAGGREVFRTPAALQAFIRDADAVVHLAGMNRGAATEIEEVNQALADQLVDALEATGATPQVLYANSVQSTRDSPYGRSKRQAAETIRRWANRTGAPFSNLVLPHVFGEGGKPFHNSVVSTFCHQLATGLGPVIENDISLSLLHAQDVSALILQAIEAGYDGELTGDGDPLRVSELLDILRCLSDHYLQNRFPDLRGSLDLNLFNTFRSYLFPQHYPLALTLHTDHRGSLFEAVRTDTNGQTFMSITEPGITRGNHFHLRKVERFIVIEGEAIIRLRRLFSDQIVEFQVNGDLKQCVDIPTMHTHNIENTGSTHLLTLFWANDIFDPTAPDTIPEPV